MLRILNGLEDETKPGQDLRFLPNELVRLHHMGADGPIPIDPEKNPDGGTTLYSMTEFAPKGDEALARRYLQGRYGGVPVLNPAEFEQAADETGA